MRDRNVIGLAGHMGCGKDAVALVLAEYGYERVAFADAVRAEVDYARTACKAPDSMPQEMVDDLWALEYDEVTRKPTTPRARRILQWWGTELRRSQLADYWVRRLEERLQPHGKYAIADVRFPNECEMVHRLGGEVWRIERPNTELYGIPEHVSESYTLGDKAIHNTGTLEDLRAIVRRMVE